jgi:hypothetical protein
MSTTKPLGPFKLVTVNTAPERAYRLIGRVVENVKDKYTIIHAGNADSMSTGWTTWLKLADPNIDQEQVREVVTRTQPDVLVRKAVSTVQQARD